MRELVSIEFDGVVITTATHSAVEMKSLDACRDTQLK